LPGVPTSTPQISPNFQLPNFQIPLSWPPSRQQVRRLQPVLPFRFRLRPPCPGGGSHPRSADRAHFSPLFWSGLLLRGPHFGPTGGNSDASGFRTGHFLSAPAFTRSGGPAAARDCFDLALKRFDLLLYRNQFSQLLDGQVLQSCHICGQAALPPRFMSRKDAPQTGRATRRPKCVKGQGLRNPKILPPSPRLRASIRGPARCFLKTTPTSAGWRKCLIDSRLWGFSAVRAGNFRGFAEKSVPVRASGTIQSPITGLGGDLGPN